MGKHKESGAARLRRDEDDVEKVLETLTSWVNPFTLTTLVNLSSGTVASAELQCDLLQAYAKGEAAVQKFTAERLAKQDVSIYDPIPAMKLLTFSKDANRRQQKEKVNRVVTLKADRSLFGRMVVMAQARTFDMRTLFSHCLGPIPWSLAAADGTPVKTTKAKMLHVLEEGIPPVEEIPSDASYIIDAMAMLQSLPGVHATFGDLASVVFTRVVSCLPTATEENRSPRVDFVCDQYRDQSIKNLERRRRAGAVEPVRVMITRPEQRVPHHWKRYLLHGANKTDLLCFLCKHWQQDEKFADQLGHGMHLFVTNGEECTRLKCMSEGHHSVMVMEDVPSLNCNHEEADTRLLLYAAHAATSGYRTVIIRSPDTDVALLAATFASSMQCQLLFCTGTKQRTRYIDISHIARRLGDGVCQALPGLHALTGCDTTSAFVGKGKKAGLQLIMKNQHHRAALTRLGQTFILDAPNAVECIEFTCALDGKPGAADVNEVRYQMFCANACQAHQLPPCQDALLKHISRANYQAAIWRLSLAQSPAVPSPIGHGWLSNENGQLAIDWMSIQPAPQDIMALMCCSCTRGCTTRRCSCMKGGLSCTDACHCKKCLNPPNHAHGSFIQQRQEQDLKQERQQQDHWQLQQQLQQPEPVRCQSATLSCLSSAVPGLNSDDENADSSGDNTDNTLSGDDSAAETDGADVW